MGGGGKGTNKQTKKDGRERAQLRERKLIHRAHEALSSRPLPSLTTTLRLTPHPEGRRQARRRGEARGGGRGRAHMLMRLLFADSSM